MTTDSEITKKRDTAYALSLSPIADDLSPMRYYDHESRFDPLYFFPV